MRSRPYTIRPLIPAVLLLVSSLLPLARGRSDTSAGRTPRPALLVTLAEKEDDGVRVALQRELLAELSRIPLLPLANPSPLERALLDQAERRGEDALRAAIRSLCKGRKVERLVLVRLDRPLDVRRREHARIVRCEVRDGRSGDVLTRHAHPRLFGRRSPDEARRLSVLALGEAVRPFLTDGATPTPAGTASLRDVSTAAPPPTLSARAEASGNRAPALSPTSPRPEAPRRIAAAVPPTSPPPESSGAPAPPVVVSRPASDEGGRSPRTSSPPPPPRRERHVLLAELLFAPGRASLDESARRRLLEETFVMARHADALVLVEGHGGGGDRAAAEELARRRADAVGEFLVAVGKLSPSRLVGYGLPFREPAPDAVTVSLVLPPEGAPAPVAPAMKEASPSAAEAPDWIDVPGLPRAEGKPGALAPTETAALPSGTSPRPAEERSHLPAEERSHRDDSDETREVARLLRHYRRRHASQRLSRATDAPEVMPPPPRLDALRRRSFAARAPAISEEGRPIAPGDAFRIEVMGHPELERKVVVRPDGRVPFPLVGHVNAEGLTQDGLRRALTEALEDFIVKVRVFVRPLYLVKVIGSVKKTGVHSFEVPPDLLDLMAAAGGATETEFQTYAALQTGYLPKPRLMGKIMSKRAPDRVFELSEVLRDSALARATTFGHGDTLLVYRDEQNMIFVTGAIENRVIYERDMRLLQALIVAAGVDDRSKLNVKKVIVWRTDRRLGRVFKYEINLDDILFKGQVHRNMILRPGDMIVVPHRKKRRGLPLIANDFAGPLSTIANLFLLGKQF